MTSYTHLKRVRLEGGDGAAVSVYRLGLALGCGNSSENAIHVTLFARATCVKQLLLMRLRVRHPLFRHHRQHSIAEQRLHFAARLACVRRK